MSRAGLDSARVPRAGEPISGSRTFLQLLLVENATLQGYVVERSAPTALQRPGWAVKNRAMNWTKVFAILIGALLAAVPVHGQGNVEAIVGQNVRPILPQNGREAALR